MADSKIQDKWAYRLLLSKIIQSYILLGVLTLVGMSALEAYSVGYSKKLVQPPYWYVIFVAYPLIVMLIIAFRYDDKSNVMPTIFTKNNYGWYFWAILILLWPEGIAYLIYRLATIDVHDFLSNLAGEVKGVRELQDSNPLLAQRLAIERHIAEIDALPPEEKSREVWINSKRQAVETLNHLNKIPLIMRESAAKVKGARVLDQIADIKLEADAFIIAHQEQFIEGHGKEILDIERKLTDAFDPKRLKRISSMQLNSAPEEEKKSDYPGQR